MHRILENWIVSIKMQCSLGSLWIYHWSQNYCAF